MKEYTTEFIRNIALVSHGSAGKSMLAEAFLHFTGATTRLGRIEDGTTVSDFEDEEIRRKISLSTTLIPVEYKEHKIKFPRHSWLYRFCRRGDLCTACGRWRHGADRLGGGR